MNLGVHQPAHSVQLSQQYPNSVPYKPTLLTSVCDLVLRYVCESGSVSREVTSQAEGSMPIYRTHRKQA